MITIGSRVPPARLAAFRDGELRHVQIEDVLQGRKALVIGVPGAFTPVCTSEHLPDLIANAPALRTAGFARIVCIAPNDPYALAAWQAQVDPTGILTMLSDGNLDFSRACGLTVREAGLFLGERTARFLMVTEDAVVTKLNVERSILNVAVSRPREVLLAA